MSSFDVAERPVDRGEAHVGDVVDVAQRRHDGVADARRRDLLLARPPRASRSMRSTACSSTSTGTGRFEQAFLRPLRILARSNGSRRPSFLIDQRQDLVDALVGREAPAAARRTRAGGG